MYMHARAYCVFTFEEDVFLGTLGRPVQTADIRERDEKLESENIH
jgi:hypothetical protein